MTWKQIINFITILGCYPYLPRQPGGFKRSLSEKLEYDSSRVNPPWRFLGTYINNRLCPVLVADTWCANTFWHVTFDQSDTRDTHILSWRSVRRNNSSFNMSLGVESPSSLQTTFRCGWFTMILEKGSYQSQCSTCWKNGIKHEGRKECSTKK